MRFHKSHEIFSKTYQTFSSVLGLRIREGSNSAASARTSLSLRKKDEQSHENRELGTAHLGAPSSDFSKHRVPLKCSLFQNTTRELVLGKRFNDFNLKSLVTTIEKQLFGRGVPRLKKGWLGTTPAYEKTSLRHKLRRNKNAKTIAENPGLQA